MGQVPLERGAEGPEVTSDGFSGSALPGGAIDAQTSSMNSPRDRRHKGSCVRRRLETLRAACARVMLELSTRDIAFIRYKRTHWKLSHPA